MSDKLNGENTPRVICDVVLERIGCIDRKTDAEVLNLITAAIKKRRWEMIGHVLSHGEKLHHMII